MPFNSVNSLPCTIIPQNSNTITPTTPISKHQHHVIIRCFHSSRSPADDLLPVDFESRLLARSPFTQCLMIQGCFWTWSRGILFSGSRTRSYFTSAVSTLRLEPVKTHSFDEIPCLGAHETGHCHLAPGDPPLGHDWCVLEWRFSNQKLVGQDT